jgi:hypothetical protein
MNIVYKRKQYNVYSVEDEYIVHNTQMKDFAHTHIKNLKACKWLIELSLKKKVPYDINKYFLVSLSRINDNEDYLRKINDLLKNKKKKEYYFNVNKGDCRKRL